jgi:hypothetical protein
LKKRIFKAKCLKILKKNFKYSAIRQRKRGSMLLSPEAAGENNAVTRRDNAQINGISDSQNATV